VKREVKRGEVDSPARGWPIWPALEQQRSKRVRSRPGSLSIARQRLAVALPLLLALGSSGCALSGAQRVPSVDRSAIENHVSSYFRKTSNLPRSATVKLTDLQPSAVPGWQEGHIVVVIDKEQQVIDFIATNDGRYLLQGEMIDLSLDPVQMTLAKLTTAGQPVRGDPAAPVTIVVFSDFQCPFCAKASGTIERKVLGTYKGRAKLIYKNLPLHQIHSWADSAAIAGECALLESNDCFWAVHDAFFDQQSQITNRNLKEIATKAVQKAGGDPKRFGRSRQPRGQVDPHVLHQWAPRHRGPADRRIHRHSRRGTRGQVNRRPRLFGRSRVRRSIGGGRRRPGRPLDARGTGG
jgi:protein-disulfide isomerase